jgi:HEAT repeat protein
LAALCLVSTASAGDEPKKDQPAEATAPKRTPEQYQALRKLVLDGLANENAHVRAAAANALLAAWPDSAPLLDEVLSSKSRGVRLEAVEILTSLDIADAKDRLRARFKDRDEDVRRQAVRVACRSTKWPEIETELERLVESDSVWIVRQEALRGLENHGTIKCIDVVLRGWLGERDLDRKARYRRVLKSVVGKDCGDDVDAWCAAIMDARSAKATAKK